MNRKVNCIIPAFNVARYLDDSIQSVINQTIGFDNINLVIVNDGSQDDTEQVILKYYEEYDNIYYLKQENKGVSAARNRGLEYCEQQLPAPYTCFLDGDDKYDRFHLEQTINFFENISFITSTLQRNKNYKDIVSYPDVVFIPIKLFEKENSVHYSYQTIDRGETRVIDLKDSCFFFSHVNSALFKSDAIREERFNEELKISEDAQFIIKILLKTNLAGWINDGETYYYLRKRMDQSSVIDNADVNPALYERIEIYRHEFENFLDLYGEIPRIVQSSVLYDIHWFKSPNNNPSKNGINLDVEKALCDIKFLISHMDDELLSQEYIPYWYKAYFKEMKYGSFHIVQHNNEIEPNFFCGNHFFEPVAGTLQIQWVKQINNRLKVRGFYVKPNYSEISLIAKFNGNKINIETSFSHHNDKKYYLGQEIFPAVDFEFSINLSSIRKNKLLFYFKYREQLIAPIAITHGWTSRFNDNKIFIGQNFIIENLGLCNGFSINKIRNRDFLESSLLPHQYSFADNYLISRYIEYFSMYRKKRIWLFIDRHSAIGDNAEALFRYCVWKKDGIEKYMVVPDASYVNQFIGMRNRVIIFGSFEYKFLLMVAEKIISSVTLFEFLNIETNISGLELVKMARALSSAQQVFLQHGITKDYGIIQDYINSSLRDIDLLITGTKKEQQLFLSESAGFKDSQVKLTGFPRYDLLKNNPEKIITYIPTWRKRYSNDDDTYNPSFKYSELFDSINDFLTNEKLISALKKQEYRLIFKIHPKMQVQLRDFENFENVELICDEISYNELFEKSSVIITDYSSVAFDFAYLKKPVIYCQTVEPEYEQKYELFNYKEDGFGEVFDSQNKAVHYLIEMMKSGCDMPMQYQRRVDQFFKFKDSNNCKRVYKEILKMPKKVKMSRLRWVKNRILVQYQKMLK